MKYVLTFAFLLLCSCSSTPIQPKPFETGNAITTPDACLKLRKDVEQYNSTHTIKKMADC